MVGNKADAQIQAHKKQHHQRKTKLLMISAGLVLAAILSVIVYYFISKEPSSTDQKIDIAPIAPVSQAQNAKLRDAFKQALTQYETQIQPQIDQIALSGYESGQLSELSLLKEQSVTAFAQGSFTQAKQTLENLGEKANKLISAWQVQIQKFVDDGQQAFNNDDIVQAQLQVNKALALSPNNSKALDLQNRIDAYGEASKLVEELKRAMYENDWPKQVEVITDIIEIDPMRTEFADDLANAQAQYEKQQLADYLQQAQNALKANRLTEASQFVQRAKAIKPNSKGAAALNNQINQARSAQSLTAIIASVEIAVASDDWERVSSLSQSALQQYPNNTALQNFQSQAQQVLSAKKTLAGFIARPQRLADENIRLAATQALQSSFSASLLSPSLQQQMEVLAAGIDQYSEPVIVTIISDGKTYITVVGVGHVGEQKQKEISLTPGDYVLQGKRDGYRSKRMAFSVKANTPLSITLICDEPI